MSAEQYSTIRLILGDQLNLKHSWFENQDPSTLHVLAELREEATYTRHHIQKVAAFFLAMTKFSEELHESGHNVLHLSLDETTEYADACSLLTALASKYSVTRFEYQHPDEHRLRESLQALDIPGVEIQAYDTEHFLVPFEQLERLFKRGRAHRMESFYRQQRKVHDILMDGDSPEGGQWNYDKSNRKTISAQELARIPAPLLFTNDVSKILKRLEKHEIPTIGTRSVLIDFPVDRDQSLRLLDYFCEHCLPKFGDYQDAMTGQSEHAWSLCHSRLSFSLNTKMLHPREVINAVVASYNAGQADITQAEGFIRQIMGWREFVRGMYWGNMPEYASMNYLNATDQLPGYFWTGETDMNCVHHAVTQSLDHAYAHHIHRLMVTGQLGLLAGIDPEEMDAWYLGIYADAIEWVQLPNTRGMSQYADGGLIASKPYAASGNYINKMSDYCRSCKYNVKSRSDADACPFNSLYWAFMNQHRSRFENNPRMKMAYVTWDRFDEQSRNAVLNRAQFCLEHLEEL